jgi:hypothetical protein
MLHHSRHLRILLSLAVLCCLQLSLVMGHDRNPARRNAVSWNLNNRNLPLLSVTDVVRGDLNELLAFPAAEFSFPISQPLAYSTNCDCYSMTVVTKGSSTLRVVQLWRVTAGFYRSQNGPYLELEDFGPLTSVTALDGTRYLFAEVGTGERRCASIHTQTGNHLLIDYTAEGLIRRLRDSSSRTVIPGYKEGRIVSLNQTWTDRTGAHSQTTVVVP